MSDNIQQTAPRQRSRNRLWLFLSIALILIIGIAITPAILRNIEENIDEQCKNNINQLALALKQYAMDYADRFPNGNGIEGLSKLQGEYLKDYSSCFCPSAKTKTVHGKLTDKDISYVYFGGFMDTSSECKGHTLEDIVPLCPVLFDHPKNHKDHVNYIDEDGQFKTLSTKVKTCSEFIDELNKKLKYNPVLLKILLEKAAEADRRYSQEK